MAWADLTPFAEGAQDSLQILLAKRLEAQQRAEKQRQQAFENQRQLGADQRARQQLDATLEGNRLQREQAQRNFDRTADREDSKDLQAKREGWLPNQILSNGTPILEDWKKAGIQTGIALPPVAPRLYTSPTDTEGVAGPRPSGSVGTFLTETPKQHETRVDDQRQAAQAQRSADALEETRRHNRVMEAEDRGAEKRQWVDRGGSPVFTSEVQPGDKPYQPSRPAEITSTGQQKASVAFLNRMLEAERNARAVEDAMGGRDMAAQQYAPGWLENWLQSKEGQQYTQAQRAFTEARLRKESGAAIPAHEYTNDRRTNFRVAGDTPAVIAKKRQQRVATLRGLAFTAGKALQDYYGADASIDSLIAALDNGGGNGDQGGGNGTVLMVAPDGAERAVPANQVEFFKAKGARVK